MTLSLLQYRGFIWRQSVADLRRRYAGTTMGIVWNVLHPLAMIAIYSVVFSTIMPIGLAGFSSQGSYALYLCAGLFPWMAFSDSVMRGCNAFVGNANYLKKLPIPEYVFVAQGAASAALNLGINISLLVVVAMALGFAPTVYWLLLPLPLAGLLLLGFSFGLLLASINVFFRDTAELTGVVLQVVMWTTPIVYLRDKLPAWLQSAMLFHPVYPGIETMHDLFLFSRLPPASIWLAMAAWPIAILLAASLALRALRPEIRDLI